MMHFPQDPTGEAIALTHGAGGDCNSALLLAIAEAFVQAGIAVLRFDLAFRKLGRPPGPGTGAKDRDSIREALDELRRHAAGPIYLAGQSYGGRQASMVAAEEPACAAALALFSYPLHPPGKPARLRTEHFGQSVRLPFFVHGPRDPFASTAELESACAGIPARTSIYEVAKAGHDLLRGKFSVSPVVEVLRAVAS